MRIFHNANYDFMGKRKKMYLLSSAIILIGFIILFAFKTIPLGIDFIGGTEMQMQFSNDVNLAIVRPSDNVNIDEMMTGVTYTTFVSIDDALNSLFTK